MNQGKQECASYVGNFEKIWPVRAMKEKSEYMISFLQ
jgi:hypothetical protein